MPIATVKANHRRVSGSIGSQGNESLNFLSIGILQVVRFEDFQDKDVGMRIIRILIRDGLVSIQYDNGVEIDRTFGPSLL